MLDITILGADGSRFDVSGPRAGRQGIMLAAGQVSGIYDAPVTTEWARSAREVGGRYRASQRGWRDMILGFHVDGDESDLGWEWIDARLRRAFTYEQDPWDPAEQLARLVIRSTRDTRLLRVQMSGEPEFAPDFDPTVDGFETIQVKLRAGQPFWEGRTEVTAFETSTASGEGTIVVSNPTDVPMEHSWVLTPGSWLIPDVSWEGPKGGRRPGGPFATKAVRVGPITEVHGGARVSLDPMRLMLASATGTNLLGEHATRGFFEHVIPPYTPPTPLPIAVLDAPVGGARAELIQPRRWSRPWGLEWR